MLVLLNGAEWSCLQSGVAYRGHDHLISFGFAARSENAEYCEYDLDSDDEHWLLQFNSERKILPPEKYSF
jgi:hypothetical protein